MAQATALLSVTELERRSSVSKFTWRLWLRQRKLPSVRLGSRVLVREVDYEAFVAAHVTPAQGPSHRNGRGRG